MRTILLALLALSPLAGAQFVDVTSDAGLAFPFLPEFTAQTDEPTFAVGLAVGDHDGDGWDDVYWHGGLGGTNRLYRNDGDGTFTDVAASAGVDLQIPGSDAKWVDVDDDGDLDLFLTCYRSYAFEGGPEIRRNYLFRNEGDGTFTDVTVEAGLEDSGTFGSSWGDLDGDQDLDLVGVSWRQSDPTLFFRNEGTGVFVDATPPDITADPINGFAPTIFDYDEDGDADVLIAADFDTSRVYANDGDWTFTNLSATINDGGDLTDDNGMGSCFGDIDGDLDMDWYVTSIYVPIEISPGPWGAKTGNRMWRNNGDGTVSDATNATGTRFGGWGWGAEFGDLDNDGDVDLCEVNGYTISTEELDPWIVFDALRLYDNDGTGSFTDIAAEQGIVDTDQNRSVSIFDYDRDGRLDILVGNWDVGLTLYRNERPDVGGWIQVETRGSTSNHYGVGARILLQADGEPEQVRWMLLGDNYLSQSPLYEHFGTGASVVDLLVDWPSGATTTHENLPAGRRVTVYEDDAWADLGNAKPGTGGLVPSLGGEGPMTPDSGNALHVADALPLTTMFLFVGVAQLNAPFKGGVLVPAPLIPSIALPTGPAGAFTLPFTWPSGIPAGTSVYWQVWVSDPGATKSLSASNGLSGTAF